MTPFAPALAILAALAAPRVELVRQPARLVAPAAPGEPARDDRVSAADASGVAKAIGPPLEGTRGTVWSVPGARGRLFVAAVAAPPEGGGAYGQRLWLVEKGASGFALLDRTAGAQDSYVLEPVFFSGGGRVVVLARIGTEYAWGAVVHELAGGKLVPLGAIGASSAAGAEDVVDPLPHTRVWLEGGRLVVTVDGDEVEYGPDGAATVLEAPVVRAVEDGALRVRASGKAAGKLPRPAGRPDALVAQARAVYQQNRAALDAGRLVRDARDACRPPSHDVRRVAFREPGPDGRVRVYVTEGGSDDSAYRLEHHYDASGRLRFALGRAGAVSDTVVEHRLWLDAEGTVVWRDRTQRGPGYTFDPDWPFDAVVSDPAAALVERARCR